MSLKINRLSSRGFIDPATLITAGFLLVSLVGGLITTKIAQQSTENRTQAATSCYCQGSHPACASVNNSTTCGGMTPLGCSWKCMSPNPYTPTPQPTDEPDYIPPTKAPTLRPVVLTPKPTHTPIPPTPTEEPSYIPPTKTPTPRPVFLNPKPTRAPTETPKPTPIPCSDYNNDSLCLMAGCDWDYNNLITPCFPMGTARPPTPTYKPTPTPTPVRCCQGTSPECGSLTNYSACTNTTDPFSCYWQTSASCIMPPTWTPRPTPTPTQSSCDNLVCPDNQSCFEGKCLPCIDAYDQSGKKSGLNCLGDHRYCRGASTCLHICKSNNYRYIDDDNFISYQEGYYCGAFEPGHICNNNSDCTSLCCRFPNTQAKDKQCQEEKYCPISSNEISNQITTNNGYITQEYFDDIMGSQCYPSNFPDTIIKIVKDDGNVKTCNIKCQSIQYGKYVLLADRCIIHSASSISDATYYCKNDIVMKKEPGRLDTFIEKCGSITDRNNQSTPLCQDGKCVQFKNTRCINEGEVKVDSTSTNKYLSCQQGVWKPLLESVDIHFSYCSLKEQEFILDILAKEDQYTNTNHKPLNISCYEQMSNGLLGAYNGNTPNVYLDCNNLLSPADKRLCAYLIYHELNHLQTNENNQLLLDYSQNFLCKENPNNPGTYEVSTNDKNATTYSQQSCSELLAYHIGVYKLNPCDFQKDYPEHYAWFTSKLTNPPTCIIPPTPTPSATPTPSPLPTLTLTPFINRCTNQFTSGGYSLEPTLTCYGCKDGVMITDPNPLDCICRFMPNDIEYITPPPGQCYSCAGDKAVINSGFGCLIKTEDE